MLMHALILTLYRIHENCNQLTSEVALVTLPYREASVYEAFFPQTVCLPLGRDTKPAVYETSICAYISQVTVCLARMCCTETAQYPNHLRCNFTAL